MPPRDAPVRLACAECGTVLAEDDDRCAACGAPVREHPLDHGRTSAEERLLFEDRTPAWVYWTLLVVGTFAVFVTYLFWKSDVGGFLTFGFFLEFVLYLVVVGFSLVRLGRKNDWRGRGRAWVLRNQRAMASLGKATTSGFAKAGKGFTTGFTSTERPNFLVRFVFRIVRIGMWFYRKTRALLLFVWRLARGILRLAYRIVRWALRLSWRIVYWVLRWWPIRYVTRFVDPFVRPKVEPVLLKLDVDICKLLLIPVPPERMARYEELGLARRQREAAEEAEMEAEVAEEVAGEERRRNRRLGLGRRREDEPDAEAEPQPSAEGDATRRRSVSAESEKMAVTDADAPPRPAPVVEIEGVGPAYAAKLQALGVNSTNDLLARDPVQLANELNEPETMVLKWHAMADLVRLDGVGKQYAEVLARVGVASIDDLSRRSPKELAEAAVKDQESVGVTIQKNPITEKRVKGWVKEAGAWLKNEAKEKQRAQKEAEKEEARRAGGAQGASAPRRGFRLGFGPKEAGKAAKAEARQAKKSGSANAIEK